MSINVNISVCSQSILGMYFLKRQTAKYIHRKAWQWSLFPRQINSVLTMYGFLSAGLILAEISPLTVSSSSISVDWAIYREIWDLISSIIVIWNTVPPYVVSYTFHKNHVSTSGSILTILRWLSVWQNWYRVLCIHIHCFRKCWISFCNPIQELIDTAKSCDSAIVRVLCMYIWWVWSLYSVSFTHE